MCMQINAMDCITILFYESFPSHFLLILPDSHSLSTSSIFFISLSPCPQTPHTHPDVLSLTPSLSPSHTLTLSLSPTGVVSVHRRGPSAVGAYNWLVSVLQANGAYEGQTLFPVSVRAHFVLTFTSDVMRIFFGICFYG